MQKSPSLEASNRSASQEIPCPLWNPEGSLPSSQKPSTRPYPDPHESSP